MSYSKIRAYFKQRIEAVSPDRSEWTDALSIDDAQNIPTTLVEQRYHIEVGTISSTTQLDQTVTDSASVLVTIWEQGYNTPQDNKDELLDESELIRTSAVNPLNVEAFNVANSVYIQRIDGVSITPSEIDASNDNIVQVQIEYTATLLCGVTS